MRPTTPRESLRSWSKPLWCLVFLLSVWSASGCGGAPPLTPEQAQEALSVSLDAARYARDRIAREVQVLPVVKAAAADPQLPVAWVRGVPSEFAVTGTLSARGGGVMTLAGGGEVTDEGYDLSLMTHFRAWRDPNLDLTLDGDLRVDLAGVGSLRTADSAVAGVEVLRGELILSGSIVGPAEVDVRLRRSATDLVVCGQVGGVPMRRGACD